MTDPSGPREPHLGSASPDDRGRASAGTQPPPEIRTHGNAYNIFILVLTVFSLALMVLQLLPVTPAEQELLLMYDNVVCGIFLIDFAMNLLGAAPRGAYFFGQRGWLDLLGSFPSLGVLRITALLRLARLSRLARITRLLRGQAGKDLVLDVLRGDHRLRVGADLGAVEVEVHDALREQLARRQHQDGR